MLVDPHLLAQAAHGKRRHGKANVMLSHSLASSADVGPAPVVLVEIRQELLAIAAAIQRLGMELLVIDTGRSHRPSGLAVELARHGGGRYQPLPDATPQAISAATRPWPGRAGPQAGTPAKAEAIAQ